MCLRFVFLLITRLASGLRLSRREATWKTAEVLILRHQLAVLQRRQPRRPKLNWADRALFAALPGVIDRKSTRLNSSHLVISDAGFCLKKMKGPGWLSRPGTDRTVVRTRAKTPRARPPRRRAASRSLHRSACGAVQRLLLFFF